MPFLLSIIIAWISPVILLEVNMLYLIHFTYFVPCKTLK